MMVLIRFAMIILIVFIVTVTTTELYREVMKTFSYTFGLKMFECGEKANYTQRITADILDFWKEEHALQNIETGCLIICAMLKLELLDLDGELLKDHAEGYLRASGADDTMVVYLIDLYTSCRSSALSVANGCKAAQKIAKCFRNGIYEQNWIPDLEVGDNVLADLYHFWKQDRALMHRDTGCTIVCMSKKLNLLDASGKLHHGNAQEFAMKHGADDDMATKLITSIHECEKENESEEDPCLRALEVAKCFKNGMHAINWAPKIDVVITEILTEV